MLKRVWQRCNNKSNDAAYLPFGVAKYDSLGNGEGIVQITESIKLPLLSLHSNEELFYSLQSQLITGEMGGLLFNILQRQSYPH